MNEETLNALQSALRMARKVSEPRFLTVYVNSNDNSPTIGIYGALTTRESGILSMMI